MTPPLDALYAEHAGLARSVAYRSTGSRELAEEAVQDVFLALWLGRATYDPDRGPFVPWLLAVTRNKAVTLVRREEAHRRHRTGLTDELPGRVPALEDGPAVRSAVATLPAAQREALVLTFWAGWSQEEIARRAGVPVGTVKSRTFYGLRRVRDLVGASA